MTILSYGKLAKCQADQMASWPNGKLTNAIWLNGKLTKWQDDQMASWPISKLMKYQQITWQAGHVVPSWWNGKLMKLQVDEMAS